MSFLEKTKISNSAGTTIDPATESKQDTIITSLQNIEAGISPIEGYLTIQVDSDTYPQYYLSENKNGEWIMTKVTGNDTDFSLTYSAGSSDSTTAWTNRASLTYGLPQTIF